MRISDWSSDVCSSDLALGLRLYKVAMPWPLEPEGIRDFATGLEQIIVVEEKRGLVEDQLRKHLYGLANAPVIVGKCDEKGQWLFPSNGELGSCLIAARSEEHTSELQSLMRISYAVFCLQKKTNQYK